MNQRAASPYYIRAIAQKRMSILSCKMKASAGVLHQLIKALKIEQIDVCGLAGDICVLNTAKDLKNVIGSTKAQCT